jgi:hypothetical protein
VDALTSTRSFYTGVTDTLVSPLVNLSGRTRVWLQFWTKHSGTTFAPEQRGIVQASRDSGATWSDVHVIVGDGAQWHPVRVDLPQLDGARGARVRFVSRSFTWWLDAVGFASDSTLLFRTAPPVGTLEVSENPVRGTQVVFAWPASSGSALVRVFSFLGEQLASATVPAPNNEYAWDLTARGRALPNGAYIVLVEVDGRRYQRRLYLAR